VDVEVADAVVVEIEIVILVDVVVGGSVDDFCLRVGADAAMDAPATVA